VSRGWSGDSVLVVAREPADLLSRGWTSATMVSYDPRRARASVLIVEADEQVAELVSATLRAAGFEVLQAASGAEGEALGEAVRPDLFIIDRTLPDIDGLVLTARLKTRSSAAIIVLGEHGHTADAVLGLKLGADDFIAQPFEPNELEARVEAAVRHGQRRPRRRSGRRPAAPTVVRLGNLALDLARKRVTLGDQELHLTPTELDLLTAFARNPGAIFSDEDLSQLLWGQATPDTERALAAHIARLKAKLQMGRGDGPLIQRLEEEGYRLEPLDQPAEPA
jgi:two-component system, OmpR family, KDP operon response regulator KdpE